MPAAPAQPSWPQVIATTVRLWMQRRGLARQDPAPQAGAGRPERGRSSRRRASIFGAVIVVFAAGALTFALVHGQAPTATRDAGNGQRVQPGAAALRQAAASRSAAAAWVTMQVSKGSTVACDPVMCAALEARGFPAGDLLPLTAQATDPMGAQIVVATTALRDQFGNRLADIYAPVVLASFGSGDTRVDIREQAPDGSQAYLVALRADLLARQASGRELLHNRLLHVYGASRLDLSDGRVDSRLLLTLAALTAQGHSVYVSRFGGLGPHASAGVPLRMMRISALTAAKHGKASDAYLRSVLRFLRAQRAPYRAQAAVVTIRPGLTVIQIEFAAPSPLGLLGVHATP